MVIITETLTSTSHHDIFTYLDYIFPATFILSDFIHIYFHIYIYIYIERERGSFFVCVLLSLINCQLDMKLGQSSEEELDAVLKKI